MKMLNYTKVMPFLIAFFLVSGVALACDTCSGYNPGSSWTSGSQTCTCYSCPAVMCIVANADPPTQSIRCLQDGSGGLCDLSCPFNTDGKYTKCVDTPPPPTDVYPTASISANSALLVYHFNDTNPALSLASTARDSADLKRIALLKRKCPTDNPADGCLPYTGWSFMENPVSDFTFPNTTLKMVTYSWRNGAIPPSPSTVFGRYNLCVNAEDAAGHVCTGNSWASPLYPAPGGTMSDCDSTPTDGSTDNVYLDIKAAPTATISPTSATVAPGTSINFTAIASDPDGQLNRVSVYRRKCANPGCTSISHTESPYNTDGWHPAVCSTIFSKTSSYTYPCLWTPQVGDIGTWQVVVAAWHDVGANELKCFGGPYGDGTTTYNLASSYNGSGWYNCGNNDLSTITVQISAEISGKVIDSSKGCTSSNTTALPGSTGAIVTWELAPGYVPGVTSYVSSSGDYNTASSWVDANIFSLSLSGVTVPQDQTLEPECVVKIQEVKSPGVELIPSSIYMGFVPSWTSSTEVAGANIFNLGYRFKSALTIGWITSLGGDVFNGGSINQTVPTVAATSFSGTLIQDALYGSRAFADGTLEVKTPGNVSKIYDRSDINGSTSGIATSNFDIPGYDLSAPANAATLNSFINIPTDKAYKMDVSAFNTASAGPIAYSVSGGKTAVLYLTGSGDVRFQRNLIPSSGRLLIITRNNVIFDSTLGIPSPAPTSLPQIQAFILTSGSITIKSTNDTPTEKTLIVDGALVSTKGDINMERDRGLTNNYPALVVRYDPTYIYTLTSQEHASTAPLFPDLFILNIDWSDSNE